jgi:hypothetical protein
LDEDPQPAASTDDPSPVGTTQAADMTEEPTGSATEAATMVAEPEPTPRPGGRGPRDR